MLPIIAILLLLSSTAFAEDTVKIQVLTNETTKYGEYRDAIYYSDMDSYQKAVGDGSHESEKLKRVANYVSAVENPQPPYEPTKKELEDAKAQLESQIAELDIKIAEKSK